MHVQVPDYEIMELPNGDLALTFPLVQALREHLPEHLTWDGQSLVLTTVDPIARRPTAQLSFAPLTEEGEDVLRHGGQVWMCGLQEGDNPVVFGRQFVLPAQFLEARKS